MGVTSPVLDINVSMTVTVAPSRILSAREITLHLLGLTLLLSLLGLWYWLSTGARVVPTLMEMLKDDDPSTRIVAAEHLGQIGPAAGAAIPQLLAQATQDGNQHANTTAAAALKWIDLATARRVMTHFMTRLQDTDVQQRRTACAVLGSIGPVATPAVPALLVAAHDADALVRRNALTALAGIGIPHDIVGAALLAGLRDSSSLVRQTAVAQFAFTVPLFDDAAAALTALLNDSDKGIATLARTALDKPKAGDAAHIESLGMMLAHNNARDYALHQLAQLGPAASAATQAILPLLDDEHPLIRYLAVETLAGMGQGAKQTLAALKLRRDSDPIVQAAITEMVAALESGTALDPGRPAGIPGP
ncbi:MAG: HEAT repeat domain-containing protein [Nitrospira sp.]|nr:HEAT repeat domain-containing protein [Nitrospira sp.]